jgi:hypothetical protein
VRLLTVSLLGITLLSSACTIANYSPAIPEKQLPAAATNKSGLLSFSYLTDTPHNYSDDKDSLRTLPKTVQHVREILKRNTRFETVLVTATPPAKGPHVNIYQTSVPELSALCIASIWTLGIIPCYAEGIVYTVHFDVLVDNTPLKAYEDEISRKAANWIGFLPFVWINFLVSTSYEEAFLATVHNFTKSARQDGLLEPPETYSSLNPSTTGCLAAQRAGK